jgi:FlgN protein.
MGGYLMERQSLEVSDKLSLFEELYSLTVEQGKAIDNRDFDALTALIEKKQQVINAIDSINVKDAIDRVSSSTEQLKEIKNKIKTADDINRDKMISIANLLSEKLGAIKTKRRQIKALYMNIGDSGNFLDKRG